MFLYMMADFFFLHIWWLSWVPVLSLKLQLVIRPEFNFTGFSFMYE